MVMTLKIAAEAKLPTRYGAFKAIGFEGFADGREHIAIVCGDVRGQRDVLGRVHSECLTGDVFGSLRCDCGPQLDAALKTIATAGRGVVFYLRQEGRGIGLLNKLKAYELQEKGYDTLEANHALGFEGDLRTYDCAAQMCAALEIASLQLLTNNPEKVGTLHNWGIPVRRIPLLTAVGVDNEGYLRTKAERMGHLLPELRSKNN